MATGPFDQSHLYVQWGGKLPGNEIWSCGLRMARTTLTGGLPLFPNDGSAAQYLNGYIKDAVQEYHTRPQTGLSQHAKLSFVKANVIGTDGQYVEQATNEYVYPDIGGNYGIIMYPNQVTVCVSLTTGFTRGPAHRGRFYLPLPVGAVNAQGLLTEDYCTDLANSTKTFIEALSDVPGIDTPGSLGVSVMSRLSGRAASRRVTGVEVGRVLDTQRRRRNKLTEQYKVSAVDQGTF